MSTYNRQTLEFQFNLLVSSVTGFCSGILTRCLPARCPMCRTPATKGFCEYCLQYLTPVAAHCPLCGTANTNSMLCGQCLIKPPAQDDCIVACIYQQPISRFIQALKYGKQLHMAPALSYTLCRSIEKTWTDLPDVIVPVPLHTKRLRTRGFNQALEIARILSNYFSIPLERNALIRTRNTVSQTALSEKARIRNLRGAFNLRDKKLLLYEHVAVVDDVITSGSTMDEIAQTLKHAGVKRVSAWAIAKTRQ